MANNRINSCSLQSKIMSNITKIISSLTIWIVVYDSQNALIAIFVFEVLSETFKELCEAQKGDLENCNVNAQYYYLYVIVRHRFDDTCSLYQLHTMVPVLGHFSWINQYWYLQSKEEVHLIHHHNSVAQFFESLNHVIWWNED